jgi:hypothetical protein
MYYVERKRSLDRSSRDSECGRAIRLSGKKPNLILNVPQIYYSDFSTEESFDTAREWCGMLDSFGGRMVVFSHKSDMAWLFLSKFVRGPLFSSLSSVTAVRASMIFLVALRFP